MCREKERAGNSRERGFEKVKVSRVKKEGVYIEEEKECIDLGRECEGSNVVKRWIAMVKMMTRIFQLLLRPPPNN